MIFSDFCMSYNRGTTAPIKPGDTSTQKVARTKLQHLLWGEGDAHAQREGVRLAVCDGQLRTTRVLQAPVLPLCLWRKHEK